MADILQRAAVTPMALPGGGGIGVMGRFLKIGSPTTGKVIRGRWSAGPRGTK